MINTSRSHPKRSPDPCAEHAPLLRTCGLRCGFGTGWVATGTPLPDLAIQRGNLIIVSGDNGAGKTTLLRTLAGELPPLHGEIRRKPGLDVLHLPQQAALPRSGPFSVADLVSLAGNPAHPWLPAASDVRVDRLSGGQRQRLWLALALSCRCDLLLLDEPTRYLDAEGRNRFHASLQPDTPFCQAQAVVMVSHDDACHAATLPGVQRIRLDNGCAATPRNALQPTP